MTAVNPIINTLNAPFWDAAKDGVLLLPFCLQTRHAFWPPSPFSPFVTGGVVEWRTATPEGALLARVTYRRAFLKAFDPLMPYAIGLVELDEGPRLQAHIVRPDDAASPKAGERVRLSFARLLDDVPILTALTLS
jgi:uncharacterized OB-fold protein